MPTADRLDYAPPPPPSSSARIVVIFFTHIVGWAVAIAMAAFVSVYLAPKFEQAAADFKLALPLPSALVLRFAVHVRDGTMYPVLTFLALAHSLAAAAWLSRGGRGRRQLYRLLLTLLLGAVVLFVVLALFLPMVGLMDSLGGASGK